MDVLKYFICKIFVLTFCTTYNAATVNAFSSNYFHGVADVTILVGQHRSEGKSVSRLACVNKCLDCPFLTFDVNTHECKSFLYANNTMIPSPGVEVWFNEPIKLFIAQNPDNSMMTYSEAELLCGQVKGRLSTTLELMDAWEMGYHMCRCGWVLDETVRLSVTFDDPLCELQGITTSSIHTCKDSNGNYPNVVQSAYCTRI